MNIVYTAIFGEYDILHEIKLEEGWRAICFTDQDIKSESWEIVKVEKTKKIYREIKCRPLHFLPEGWTKCIWIDGNLGFKGSISEFASGKDGFWLMTHPERNCIYDEAQRCKELKKDINEIIDAQMERYRESGYPEKNGLSATGVLVRTASYEIYEFCEEWWEEINDGSVRDQLSFNYLAWKLKLKFQMFPFLEGFNYHYHIHKAKELERRKKRNAELRAMNRVQKLKARRTAEYYKRYGNKDGDNSKTY